MSVVISYLYVDTWPTYLGRDFEREYTKIIWSFQCHTLIRLFACNPFLITTKLAESVHYIHTLNKQPLFGRYFDFYKSYSHCWYLQMSVVLHWKWPMTRRRRKRAWWIVRPKKLDRCARTQFTRGSAVSWSVRWNSRHGGRQWMRQCSMGQTEIWNLKVPNKKSNSRLGGCKNLIAFDRMTRSKGAPLITPGVTKRLPNY